MAKLIITTIGDQTVFSYGERYLYATSRTRVADEVETALTRLAILTGMKIKDKR